MRNGLAVFAVLLAFISVPVAAHAQDKVGVININAAIAGSAQGKKALADLQKKYQPRQEELTRLQSDIQSIQDQLSKQAPALSDEEQRRLSRELEDKQKLLKRSADDAQTDFAADRDETVREIGQKMVRLIGEYAQQNGFSLVLDDAQVPIYYFAKGIDLTEEIIKRYDAANPVANAGPSAKPATHPAPTAPAARPH